MKAFKKTLSVLLSLVLAVTGLVGLGVSASALEFGDIIQFGIYPQTEVSETTALKNAADAATWNSYFYYIGNGNYDGCMTASDYMKYADFVSGGVRYRAVKFTKYRPKFTGYTSTEENSYQDDNGYFTNTTYYFRYEPLEWRVLDPSAGLILCETVIDSQAFQNVVRRSAGWNFYIGVSSTYANNYAESSIRTWLNNDFYNVAFNTEQRGKIKPTTINNDAHRDVYSQFNAEPTTDPIFLLSYSDALNSKYRFNFIEPRRSGCTDYAKCQGCRALNGFSDWRLRSAGDYSASACQVSYDGSVYPADDVGTTYVGVRPACIISNLNSLIHTVTVSADPTAGGTVTGGGTYSDGQKATVTATNNSGYLFSGWYNGSTKVSSNKSYTFTVTENVTLTAKFTPLSMTYTVSVAADPAEGGTVTGGGTYVSGTYATLTATWNSDWHFVGWYQNGTLVSTQRSFFRPVVSDLAYVAKFEKDSYTITVFADSAEGGTVSGGGSYPVGETATVTATPNSGWHFSGWYTDDDWYHDFAKVSSNKSYSFTVTVTVTLIAKFEKDAAPDPGQPENPDNGNGNNGSNEPAANLCKWCGKDHSDGFFQKIVAFFHNIFAKLFGKKFKPDGTPVQK